MKEKKRKHIVVYWILMVVLFLVVLFAQQIVASIMQGSLSTSKFGHETMFEILWAGLVLLVVLAFKNKYIFTQQRESFFKSFKYILPELLLSGFFILISIISLLTTNGPFDIYAVFNLILYCIFIGIVEEFLCRGWLLNEFLERYSKNRKEIILSIIFSSVIFGVVHFINIGETQGVVETLVQVMNATAGGMFLALVYYKTKNIWVVVASHAIWDFSLFLGEVNSLGECLSGTPTHVMVIVNIIRGLVLTLAYLLFCYWLYRQTDLYQKEIGNNTKDYFIAIGIALYVIGLLFINSTSEGYYTCPEYTRRKIDEPFKVSTYYYPSYQVSETTLVLELDRENGGVILKDLSTDRSINLLGKKDDVYDYIMIDNDSYYTIVIQTKTNVVLYGSFSKNNIVRNNDYLKKVKESLKTVVVPEIKELGVLDVEGDSYHYPLLISDLHQYLYFGSDGKLYIH